MKDMHDVYYDCPECDNQKLEEGSTKCPECGTELRFCDRGGHFADKSDFPEDLDMCSDCWDEMVED